VLSRGVANDRVESPQHYPDNDLVSVTSAAVWIPEVSPFGILALPIGAPLARRDGPSERVTVSAMSPVILSEAKDLLEPTAQRPKSAKYEMRNAQLVLRVDSGGGVELIERATDRRVTPLIEIEDQIDAGDLYTPAPRGAYASSALMNVRVAHRGPLRGEIAMRWRLVPATPVPRRDQSDIVTRFILDADTPYVRVLVQGSNRAADHRIRLAFHTGVSSPVVWADAAFGPVRRERLVISPADAAMETPPPTAPLHTTSRCWTRPAARRCSATD